MPRSASGERCSSTSSENAFVNVPSVNGNLRRSPINKSTSRRDTAQKHLLISAPPAPGRKTRCDDVPAGSRAPVAVPQQRTAAAAAQVHDDVVSLRGEKGSQHV